MNKYEGLNVWNKWGTLRRVVLGSMHTPEFFSTIKDDKVRTPLQWIVEETLEDLDNFETLLKQSGVEVVRPQLPTNMNFADWVSETKEGGKTGFIPVPPLTPRDDYIVIGDTGLALGSQTPNKSPEIHQVFLNEGFKELQIDVKGLGASTFHVGRDVFINVERIKTSEDIELVKQTIDNIVTDARIHMVRHEGHSDGGFHPIKRGAFLSHESPEYYKDTYVGWEPCFLEGESWAKVLGFLHAKAYTRGRFWIPGEEDNKPLADLINTWLTNWVGYVEETVFDLNVLMLDEHHMCTSNVDNVKVREFAKKHGVELVHIPWRHRYFWDGGIHCITQELYRDGVQEDYWPEGRNIVTHKKGEYI